MSVFFFVSLGRVLFHEPPCWLLAHTALPPIINLPIWLLPELLSSLKAPSTMPVFNSPPSIIWGAGRRVLGLVWRGGCPAWSSTSPNATEVHPQSNPTTDNPTTSPTQRNNENRQSQNRAKNNPIIQPWRNGAGTFQRNVAMSEHAGRRKFQFSGPKTSIPVVRNQPKCPTQPLNQQLLHQKHNHIPKTQDTNTKTKPSLDQVSCGMGYGVVGLVMGVFFWAAHVRPGASCCLTKERTIPL